MHVCLVNHQSEPLALSQASSSIEASYDSGIASGEGDVLLVPHRLHGIDDYVQADFGTLFCLPVQQDVLRTHANDHLFPLQSSQRSGLLLSQRQTGAATQSY